MHLLDDPKHLVKYDRRGVVQAVNSLSDQVNQAWKETNVLKLPADLGNVTEIVMNGMGASGLAGHIVEAVFLSRLKIPFYLTHSYGAPAYVDENTLYIVSSYSGGTEEVLSSVKSAAGRRAKILGIAAGGALGDLIEKEKIPGYKFKPTYNHGDVPRLAVGYSIFAVLGLLNNVGLLKIDEREIADVLRVIKAAYKKFNPLAPLAKNKAKKLALKLKDKIVTFVGAEFLEDSARIASNQLHETAKQFGFHFALPELNHHLLEGLAFPKELRKHEAFVFFPSKLNHLRVQKRFSITVDVVRQHKIVAHVYAPQAKTELGQVIELLVFGGYTTFYLALLNKVDPALNPWVDYFKEKLEKYN